MAKKWTLAEELLKHKELVDLYIKENKTIGEIAKILNIGESTVYDRLIRLSIKPIRHKKLRFNNKRGDVRIPKKYSSPLAEFIGILLGDGHITPTQVTVTLGNKEYNYVHHVAELINSLFKIKPRIIIRHGKYHIVYFGSTETVRWLLSMGLVFNKVKNQVGTPHWIFSKKNYVQSFLRGFFDTDGSIYKLRFGVQLAFTNRSKPLLESVKTSLSFLGYHPSRISLFRVYLTKNREIVKFFKEVGPANKKHLSRFKLLVRK